MEIGGIAELQNYANGLIDAQRYAEEIGAKMLHPPAPRQLEPAGHRGAAGYFKPWSARIAKISADRRPELCFIVEANRATAFNVNHQRMGR